MSLACMNEPGAHPKMVMAPGRAHRYELSVRMHRIPQFHWPVTSGSKRCQGKAQEKRQGQPGILAYCHMGALTCQLLCQAWFCTSGSLSVVGLATQVYWGVLSCLRPGSEKSIYLEGPSVPASINKPQNSGATEGNSVPGKH